jgi:hypothetical protein
MTGNIIVMPGSARLDIRTLQAVAGDFGWEVKVARDTREAYKAEAVFFHRDALGADCSWVDAVRLLRLALPEARLVACHGLAELIDWPELCDAGAFHALGLPLNEDEVRSSLGFIAQSLMRHEDSVSV